MADARQTLSDFTVAKNYARYLPYAKRREVYPEAVKRMMNMHRVKVAGKIAPTVLDEIEQALIDHEILGSQRALQFGGEAILNRHMRSYNCCASFADRSRFFSEALWLLLCGCGVGFSVQKHHVAKLPKVLAPDRPAYTHVIEDSIEGWADALGALMGSYFEHRLARDFTGAPFPQQAVVFDGSQVRPEGSVIRSSSGRAPGPGPLLKALEKVRVVLDACAARDGILRPVEVYDIVMHVAGCVRAGGIRRSATICIFSPDDEEMRVAKTGDWFKTNPQRRLSNNSARLLRGVTDRDQFNDLIKATQEFGDPGFSFDDSTETVPNPCGEANLDPVARSTGETGWGFCNLTSVNMAKVKTRTDFRRLCRLAATLGTIQASYDDVGYLTSATKECLTRDALLGVSLTGMADNPSMAFDGALLREGAEHVAWINRRVALELGINPAARTTLVKPEGTGSLVLKVGNGVHPHHSRRYLRYVEAGKATDPVVAFMKEHIPEAVVPSAYSSEEYKVVFPIDLGDGDLWLKAHTDPVDHLEKVKLVQKEWVDPGTTRDAAKHMVSNTISVPAHKWDEVADYIWENQDTFAGVALLGQSGDLDFEQAPFVEVLEDDEIAARYGTDPVRTEKARTAKELYGKLQAVWKDLDFMEMSEAVDQTTVSDLVACGGGACVF